MLAQIIAQQFLQTNEEELRLLNRNQINSDTTMILAYAERSIEQFVNYHRWSLCMHQTIGKDIARYFQELREVVEGEELSEIQFNNISAVLNNEPSELMYVKGSNLIEEVIDLHGSLFSWHDSYAMFDNRSTMLEDLTNHLRFMDQAISSNSEILWIEYINWLHSVIDSSEVEVKSVIHLLVTAKLVMEHQNDSANRIAMLEIGIRHFNTLIDEDSEEYVPKKRLSTEAEKYLNCLLNADRKGASDFVLELLDDKHWNIRKVYIEIFQESQYEIGRMWEKNVITVAQEHFCTATTQMIMSMLFPRLFNGKRIGLSAVATCVGSELHEIGIRMVSDFLEMEGWDTFYIGANAPAESVIKSIEDHQADLIAISVTLTPHIKEATELISALRSTHPSIKIMVGGYPFIQDPELYLKVGADGVARSAESTHEIALKLLDNNE